VPVLIVFVLASLISIFRILVTNREAFSNLVWAEDGLFPLCIQAQGYWQCLIDPYEGYFLFLSRTLALPVSFFPQSMWPLVTNVVAAISFGFLGSMITWLLLRAQLSRAVAIGAGISAVMLPIVGLETINTAGSAYMLLLVVAAITVSFSFSPQLPSYVTPIVLFTTAVTIPSAAVLILPLIAALLLNREKQRKRTFLNIVSLGFGLGIQFLVMLSATNPRSIEITNDSLREWVQQFPKAILSLLPTATQLDGVGQLEVSFYSPNLWTGVVTIIVLTGFSLYLLSQKSSQLRGAGWLIVTGFLIGFIPAISNYPINRYFVVPIIALVIALFIWLGSVFTGKYSLVTMIAITLILLIWIPDFGASKIRTDASPFWNDMLLSLQEQCRQEPESTVSFVFSPNWPFADADFKGPTSNIVRCSVVQSQKTQSSQ
jgi:hypothetical protein